MNTVLLLWDPDEQWHDLYRLPYEIDEGMCAGGFVYVKPWRLSNPKSVCEGDRFFIVCTCETPPDNDIYCYLESMGACFEDTNGLCFGGHFESIPYEDEDDPGIWKIDLELDLAILPGLFPIITEEALKLKLKDVDWDSEYTEHRLTPEDSSRLDAMLKSWLASNESLLEASSFTNFTDRDLYTMKENLSLL